MLNELRHLRQQVVGNLAGWQVRRGVDGCQQAVITEQRISIVVRLGETVGCHHQHIACTKWQRDFVILGVREDAQRQAGRFQHLGAAAVG